MKKLIMLAAGVFCTMASVQLAAQTEKKVYYTSLGPVGAIGHSQVSGLDGSNRFKLSGALGVGVVFSRNEHWGFGGQLLASHEGYSKLRRINGVDYTNTVNPIYLRMPLTVQHFFGNYGDKVRPKVYLGPNLGLKLDERQDLERVPGSEMTYSSSDQFRTFDVGLQAGAGANIRLQKRVWLNLDLGYYQGLLDAVNMPGENDYNTNQNLRINAGVMFGL